MPIKLFNQGSLTIQYGMEKNQVIKPKQTAAFDDVTAKKLCKLFPNDLLNIDESRGGQTEADKQEFAKAKKEIEAEYQKAKKEIEAQRADIASEKEEIAVEKINIANEKEEIAEQRAQLEADLEALKKAKSKK